MKHFLAGLGALVLLGWFAPAQAGLVGITGDTVAACGTPNVTPPATQPGQATIDQNGKLCVNATVSVGGVSLTAATPASSTALAGSKVVAAQAKSLFSFEVVLDSTAANAGAYVLIFNSTTDPADGAVTPLKCYYIPANTTGANTIGGTFAAGGVAFSTGITIALSSTGCFTKTETTHALFISGDAG